MTISTLISLDIPQFFLNFADHQRLGPDSKKKLDRKPRKVDFPPNYFFHKVLKFTVVAQHDFISEIVVHHGNN